MYYENNQDDDGEKIIPIIKDRKELAIELFPVVVNRILHFEDEDFYQVISRKSLATRTTIDYLKSFSNNSSPTSEINPESTSKLIRLIHGLLLQSSEKEMSAKINILNDLKNVNDFIVSKVNKN